MLYLENISGKIAHHKKKQTWGAIMCPTYHPPLLIWFYCSISTTDVFDNLIGYGKNARGLEMWAGYTLQISLQSVNNFVHLFIASVLLHLPHRKWLRIEWIDNPISARQKSCRRSRYNFLSVVVNLLKVIQRWVNMQNIPSLGQKILKQGSCLQDTKY